jgi:hypothetical protein
VLKLAMLRVASGLQRLGLVHGQAARLLIPVHDELVLEVEAGDDAGAGAGVRALVVRAMEGAGAAVLARVADSATASGNPEGWAPATSPSLPPLRVEVHEGPHWGA